MESITIGKGHGTYIVTCYWSDNSVTYETAVTLAEARKLARVLLADPMVTKATDTGDYAHPKTVWLWRQVELHKR